MRNAFLNAFMDLAKNNPKLMMLTGDLGFGVFEKFIEKYPEQYLNVGVAEQNMVGIASGLALEGYTIFLYSIGNFPTFRCLEQIRVDACYHELNVNIVNAGGGFSYGPLGVTHHATEDFAVLRALPGITIVAPCDAWETNAATHALASTPGVGYLRLEKNAISNSPQSQEPFKLGKARRIREGHDISLIAAGSITGEALQAAENLSSYNIDTRVISMHTIKPLDKQEIYTALEETNAIFTIEEHMIDGGLGGAIAEICAESRRPLRLFHRIGLPNVFSSIVGSQQFLRAKYEMDANAITQKVLSLLD